MKKTITTVQSNDERAIRGTDHDSPPIDRSGKHWMRIILCILLPLFGIIGCGKSEWKDGDRFTGGVIGADIDLSYNEADFLYMQSYKESFGLYTGGGYFGGEGTYIPSDWACSKRGAAVSMAREVFTYSFKNCFMLDGVSGFIYNVGYIFSVPHKIIRGLRCMDGVVGYLGALFKLAWGTAAAAVGVVASPIINTVVHPFETLANLTVGIIHVDGIEFLGIHPSGSNCGWFGYVVRTNIIASLWDLVWGAMIYPLWQAVAFWA